jgi:hypothetical protein
VWARRLFQRGGGFAPSENRAEMEFLDIRLTKEVQSFAPCLSQSLLLVDFQENHTLLLFLKSFLRIFVKD